jgi:hypothetical protein
LSRRVSAAKMVATVGDMCGAHAQILSTGALALAARVSRLKTERFTAAIEEEHSLVKTWAMRGTLHVLTAEDLPLYCAARRTTEMYSEPSYLEYLELKLADVEAVLEAIPSALDGKVLTREELADEVVRITRKRHLDKHLRSGWGSLLKPAAFSGLLCFGPQAGRSVTFVRADQWIGGWKHFDTDEALMEVFRRFLSAYGPASKNEVARWWGVRPPEAGRVLDLMAHELSEVEVGGTKRLALAADLRALRLSQPVEGVRLLPSFDQILVVSAPHSGAIVDDEFKERVYRQRVAVWSLPAVFVDGRVQAAWKLERRKNRALVVVEPFRTLTRTARAALSEEVERLGASLDSETKLQIGTR